MGLEDHISGHDASCFRYLDTREPMGVVAKTEPSRNSFAHRLPWRVINFWGMPVCQGRIYEMWMRWLEVLCRGQFACGFLILPFADWINMRSIHHLQGEELRRPTLDFQDWSWMSMIYIYIYIQLYIYIINMYIYIWLCIYIYNYICMSKLCQTYNYLGLFFWWKEKFARWSLELVLSNLRNLLPAMYAHVNICYIDL